MRALYLTVEMLAYWLDDVSMDDPAVFGEPVEFRLVFVPVVRMNIFYPGWEF